MVPQGRASNKAIEHLALESSESMWRGGLKRAVSARTAGIESRAQILLAGQRVRAALPDANDAHSAQMPVLRQDTGG